MTTLSNKISKDETMSNIVSECSSVDVADGGRHSKKMSTKKSPTQMSPILTSVDRTTEKKESEKNDSEVEF